MATTITGIFQAKVINALDTYNHTTLQAQMYTVSLGLTEQPPSGVIITIQQNGVTKASASAPAASQAAMSLKTTMNCAQGDLLSVIVASSSASDQNINSIKGILTITPGQVS